MGLLTHKTSCQEPDWVYLHTRLAARSQTGFTYTQGLLPGARLGLLTHKACCQEPDWVYLHTRLAASSQTGFTYTQD
jgi:hypothetical protein